MRSQFFICLISFDSYPIRYRAPNDAERIGFVNCNSSYRWGVIEIVSYRVSFSGGHAGDFKHAEFVIN
jgi:hypothetical protein